VRRPRWLAGAARCRGVADRGVPQASDQVGGDRLRGGHQARMVALDDVWLRPGYVRWKVRRIIRRSGAITVRNLSNAAGRCMRAGAFVTSVGIGGAVPLRDWRGGVVVVLG